MLMTHDLWLLINYDLLLLMTLTFVAYDFWLIMTYDSWLLITYDSLPQQFQNEEESFDYWTAHCSHMTNWD